MYKISLTKFILDNKIFNVNIFYYKMNFKNYKRVIRGDNMLDDFDLKEEIWNIVHTLRHGAEKVLSPIANSEGLTLLQVYILLYIHKYGMVSVGKLSKGVDINQGNISSMCKKLEKEGFVFRTRGHEDERVVSLKLTQKGEMAISRVREKVKKFDKILSKYPKEKIDAVIYGFNVLNEIFSQLSVEDS